jgi:ElaB/YqjD/DUF883 family membrane-anchored ribosome-binding protein
MAKDSISLKEALRSGQSLEEIRNNFEKQLSEAQKEIDKEKNKEQELDKARMQFINSLYDYAEALGYVKNKPDKEDINTAIELLKNSEKSYRFWKIW